MDHYPECTRHVDTWIISESTGNLLYFAFSSTNKENTEIELFLYCSSEHVYFRVLPQHSSPLGLYGPVVLHLLGNTGKYSPSCQTNTENQLFQYCLTRKDNTGSITFRNWEYLYYDSSQDMLWNIALALGKSLGLHTQDFSLFSDYISLYMPPLFIIQIKY